MFREAINPTLNRLYDLLSSTFYWIKLCFSSFGLYGMKNMNSICILWTRREMVVYRSRDIILVHLPVYKAAILSNVGSIPRDRWSFFNFYLPTSIVNFILCSNSIIKTEDSNNLLTCNPNINNSKNKSKIAQNKYVLYTQNTYTQQRPYTLSHTHKK